jgi:hypothetical protein
MRFARVWFLVWCGRFVLLFYRGQRCDNAGKLFHAGSAFKRGFDLRGGPRPCAWDRPFLSVDFWNGNARAVLYAGICLMRAFNAFGLTRAFYDFGLMRAFYDFGLMRAFYAVG